MRISHFICRTVWKGRRYEALRVLYWFPVMLATPDTSQNPEFILLLKITQDTEITEIVQTFSLASTPIMTSPVNPKYPFASTLDVISRLLTAASKPHLIAPRVGVVCGSGLSTLASHLRDAIEIPYTSLPGFGKSTGA